MPALQEILPKVKKLKTAVPWHARAFSRMFLKGAISDFKFYVNQQLHRDVAATPVDLRKVGTYEFSNGSFKYWLGPTEKGGIRGGEMPGEYMQGVCDGQITNQAKYDHLMKELARLPRQASFAFAAHANLRDESVVRAAFKAAGFSVKKRTTLIYQGQPGEDPIASMEKGNAKSNVMKGRRDLDVTTMDIDDYFAFYRRNLLDRNSHFFLDVDHKLMKDAVHDHPPRAEIIAARRKTGNDGKPNPIDAAIVLGISDERLTLMRISFRKAAEGDTTPPPHSQAVKMLVVEAMKRANERGLILDVGGFTPGGQTVYERFGVFEQEDGLLFSRRKLSRVPHYWQERYWS